MVFSAFDKASSSYASKSLITSFLLNKCWENQNAHDNYFHTSISYRTKFKCALKNYSFNKRAEMDRLFYPSLLDELVNVFYKY